jgi:hypothetical protein
MSTEPRAQSYIDFRFRYSLGFRALIAFTHVPVALSFPGLNLVPNVLRIHAGNAHFKPRRNGSNFAIPKIQLLLKATVRLFARFLSFL